MKKRRMVAALMLIFMLNLFLTACAAAPAAQTPSPSGDGEVLTGKIVYIGDGTCLIADARSSGLYTVPTTIDAFDAQNAPLDASALKAGQSVEIGYSGFVFTTYPAQIQGAEYIRVSGDGEDLVGLYRQAVDELWRTDEGLNPADGVLAFDLSTLTNLTDGEKDALIYLASGAYGLPGVAGTFDTLSEQGLIDKEKLFFENGMLIKIEARDVTETSFTFDASKWRSGDGAYFLFECKAVKSGGEWRYTVGSVAIS